MKIFKNIEFKKGFTHAGFYVSLGNYNDDNAHIYISLFFGALYITLNVVSNETNYCTKNPEYGFAFYNNEGVEHCLFLYLGRNVKIIDMPWHLEHYRTSIYNAKNKLVYNSYSFPKYVTRRFPNIYGVYNRFKFEIPEIIKENYKDEIYKTYKYQYKLNSGEIQERIASVYIVEREWRRKWIMWSSFKNLIIRELDIAFDKEVGEESRSWKGGVIETNFKMKNDETMDQTFNRFKKEKKI